MTTTRLVSGIFAATFAVSAMAAALNSGLGVGDRIPAFDPAHVSGPDKGTNTCPVCKYGALPAVQVWVNGGEAKDLSSIAKLLDQRAKDERFRAFVIFLTDAKGGDKAKKDLVDLATKEKLSNVALTWLDRSDRAVSAYKFNSDAAVKNTVFVYKDRKVSTKFVNLAGDKAGLDKLGSAITQVTQPTP